MGKLTLEQILFPDGPECNFAIVVDADGGRFEGSSLSVNGADPAGTAGERAEGSRTAGSRKLFR